MNRNTLSGGTKAMIAIAIFLCQAGHPVHSAETLLLRAGAVHTVSGDTLRPGEVLIEDGIITGVGFHLEPEDARVIDLGTWQLYPGIIAADTVLGLVEIGAMRASRDMTEVGDYTPDVKSWVSVNPDSELLPVARANGITHFQPVPWGGIVRGQSAVLATAGWTTEDMTIRAGVGMHLSWPNDHLNTTPKSLTRSRSKWKSLEEQDRSRRARIKAIDDFFNEAETFARSIPFSKTTPIPAWESMAPAVTGQMPLFVYANQKGQIRKAMAWAKRRNYPIVLTGSRDAWMLAKDIAKAEIPVIYDHVFTLPNQDTADYDVQFKAPSILHEAGVKVIFSQTTGFEGSDVRNLPHKAAQAMAYGLPETEAIRGITLYPAEILGVADRLGSIEKGKEASLIAVNGSLLDIRTNVKQMWIAGREISLESRHTRLYKKYRARPKKVK